MPQVPTPGDSPGLSKWIIGCLVVARFAGAVPVIGIVYVGIVTPPIEVLSGAQLPQRFASTIRDLGLLESDEQIIYFYSDAIIDITEGFYLLTDRKVVVYSTLYDEPAILVPFSDISKLDVEFDESFLTDSMIWITRENDSTVSFPVSSEKGGDKQFYEALEARE